MGMSYTWKWPPESVALGETFLCEINADQNLHSFLSGDTKISH
jgi:hypothetical protein